MLSKEHSYALIECKSLTAAAHNYTMDAGLWVRGRGVPAPGASDHQFGHKVLDIVHGIFHAMPTTGGINLNGRR